MLKEIKYTSVGKKELLVFLIEIIRIFPQATALGYAFAKRNILSRYRQSFMGILWAVFPPLATSFVWVILRGQGVVLLGEVNVPYPLFVLTGTFLWQLFSNSILFPLQAINASKSILTKVNFPRESIIIGSFFEVIFNALIGILVIIAAMAFYGYTPGLNFLFFLSYLSLLILFGLVIGLLLIPIASLYSDIQFGLPFILQFLMYLTPVIYPQPSYSGFGKILNYNPISPLLTQARSAMLDASFSADFLSIATYGIILLLGILIGMILFRTTIGILIERMGS
jgi:lipopolysaccharide transport system permease protein